VGEKALFKRAVSLIAEAWLPKYAVKVTKSHLMPSFYVCRLLRLYFAELEIAKRPDGSDWELGSGGFGKVYKALRHGVQPVAVKKLAVSDKN